MPMLAAMGAVRIEVGDDGSQRVLIDSASLAQAVYVYRPVLADDGRTVVDLFIESMNEAARNVPLSDAVVVGRLASEVFVDMEAALVSATVAWAGRAAVPYGIQRRGIVEGQPVVVHYEVSTFRAGDKIVQVSIDHTVVNQLESADDRFRTMADESNDALVLLAEGLEPGRYVPTYANRVALMVLPSLRLGRPLPDDIDEFLAPLVAELLAEGRSHTVVRHRVLARRTKSAITLLRLSGRQILMVGRELVEEEAARREIERTDRVLDAVAAGSFGAIHVLQPTFDEGRLVSVEHLWGSAGIADAGGALGLDDVLAPAALVALVSDLHDSREQRRHGWTTLTVEGRVRNVEYVMVRAGDRFVLEYVERTDELEARTSLAEVSAAVEVQRAFLSRISHELRSPLNVIHGYGQLLRMSGLSPSAAEHLSRIEDGVERMVQVVDDLIVLGQLDHGLVRFERRTVAIGEVLGMLDDLLHAEDLSVRRAVTVVVDEHSDMTVESDPVRFAEIIRLLVEASAVSAPGVTLTVGAYRRGASCGVRVDAIWPSGPLSRLWDDVISGKVVPGAGLRLAVARELSRSLDVRWERRDNERPDTATIVLLPPVTPVDSVRP